MTRDAHRPRGGTPDLSAIVPPRTPTACRGMELGGQMLWEDRARRAEAREQKIRKRLVAAERVVESARALAKYLCDDNKGIEGSAVYVTGRLNVLMRVVDDLATYDSGLRGTRDDRKPEGCE